MIKQLRFRLVLIMILFLGSLSGKIFADDISFQARANRSQIRVSEAFRVEYICSGGKGTNLSVDLSSFLRMSGPNTSSSTSISMVNGKVTNNSTYTYSYVLMAEKTGTFTIPPATITIEGKKYTSNALTIEVVPDGTATSSSTTRGGKAGAATASSSGGGADGNLFIRAHLSKSNPWLGEPVVLTYKLYYRENPVSNISAGTLSHTGFWSTDITPSPMKQYQETVNGRTYNVAEVRQFLLYPQKSGSLTIDPYKVECTVQVRERTRSPFDDFFDDPFFGGSMFSSVRHVQKPIATPRQVLQVKELPKPQPDDFSGFVGDVNLTASVSETKTRAGEPITLTLVLKGKGNLELVSDLAPQLPPDFEVYDPKISDDFKHGLGGTQGSRTFSYLIVPRTAGQFQISAVKFSYFNPATGKYNTLASKPIDIEVAKGNGVVSSVVGVDQRDIAITDTDIHYIKNGGGLHKRGRTFFGSALWWVLLLLPAVAFGLLLFFRRKQLDLQNNLGEMKRRRATKVARKRLRAAQMALTEGKNEEFYEAISQSLWGYVSDKYNIPRAQLSLDSAEEMFAKAGVSEETIATLMQTLRECEFARFAPQQAVSTQEMYDRTLAFIADLESGK